MGYLSLRIDSTDEYDDGVAGIEGIDGVDGVDGDDGDDDYDENCDDAYFVRVIIDGDHYTNLYYFYFWIILSDKVYYEEQ